MEPIQTKFIEKRKEAENTETFRFVCDLQFKAGQYILLELSDVIEDPKGNDRPFTISSSPLDKQYIEITTKISESPFKQKLSKLKIGEHVKITGPLGKFIFQEADYSLMIAGGIGITPFRSIVRYLTQIRSKSNIILLYSNKTPEEIAFRKELEKIQKINKHICVINTITRPEESKEQWAGMTGRVDEEFIKNNIENVNINNYYVCGPPFMVDSMLEILKNMQIQEDRIHVERFTGY